MREPGNERDQQQEEIYSREFHSADFIFLKRRKKKLLQVLKNVPKSLLLPFAAVQIALFSSVEAFLCSHQ